MSFKLQNPKIDQNRRLAVDAIKSERHRYGATYPPFLASNDISSETRVGACNLWTRLLYIDECLDEDIPKQVRSNAVMV